jgi:hypothetical protein
VWNGSHCWAAAADFSKRNPFVPIPINQNLYYMLENIKRYATIAVHRVPIVSLDEQVGLAFASPPPLLFSLTTLCRIRRSWPWSARATLPPTSPSISLSSDPGTLMTM